MIGALIQSSRKGSIIFALTQASRRGSMIGALTIIKEGSMIGVRI